MIRSQRSPYGTSLLGAGAVHHIKLDRGRPSLRFRNSPKADANSSLVACSEVPIRDFPLGFTRHTDIHLC